MKPGGASARGRWRSVPRPARAGTIGIAALVLAGALEAVGVGLVATLPPAGRDARPARAQPAPPARPPVRLVGSPLPCRVDSRLAPLPAAVTRGTRLTVSFTAQVACPNAVDRAAVVVMAGGATVADWPQLVAAVGVLGASFDAVDAPLAVVDAGGPPEAARWSVTAAERRAALAVLAARPADVAVGIERWSSALRSAADALAALPVTRRPLLVVVDGRRPADLVALSPADLGPVAHAVHDAAGHTVIIDASRERWLAGTVRLLQTATDAGIVGLDIDPDASPASVADGTVRLMNRLAGVVEPLATELDWDVNLTALVGDSVTPPDVHREPDLLFWQTPLANGVATLRGRFDLDTVAPGLARVQAFVTAHRTADVPAGDAESIQFVCVHEPGRTPVDCVPTPPPSATPFDGATARPTATRPPLPAPTRTPTARPSATPRPLATARPAASATPNVTVRVWLPVVRLGDGGDAGAGRRSGWPAGRP